MTELKYVVERWRMDYNHYRPHGSLDYQTYRRPMPTNAGIWDARGRIQQAVEMKNMAETLS